MKNLGQKLFTVKLSKEGEYNRIYVKHPNFKTRIRKHVGMRSKDELENIQFFLKFELEIHFAEHPVTRTAVEEYIDQYIAMRVKETASIFQFFDDFLAYKKDSTNKRTKKKLTKNTITSYVTAKEHFEKYLIKKKLSPNPAKIGKAVLDNFYQFLDGKHNYKVKMHTKVKAFVRYVDEIKNVRVDPTYKQSIFLEEYDHMEPEVDDIALTESEVRKLIELRHKLRSGEVEIEAPVYSGKIQKELQVKHFNMKKSNLIKSLDCFLFQLSYGMYHSDVMKSKISILREGNFQFLKYRRAKNGSLCKGIPVEGDDVFIGNQIIKEYNIRTGSNFPLNLSHTHYTKHLARISELAGLDFKLHNKMARKTFASILYFERNMPINLLQVLLGHQNLKDTLHYLRITDVDLAHQVKEYMFPETERELTIV